MKNLKIEDVKIIGSGFGPRGDATMVINVKPDLPESEIRNIAGVFYEEFLRYDHPMKEELVTDIREYAKGLYLMRFLYKPRHDANEPEELKMKTKDELMALIEPYVTKFEAAGKEYMRLKRVGELIHEQNPEVFVNVRYYNPSDKPWGLEIHVNTENLPEAETVKYGKRGSVWKTIYYALDEADSFTEDNARALLDTLYDEVRLDMKLNEINDSIRSMMANCDCARLFHFKAEATKVTFTSVYAREQKHEIVANNVHELLITVSSLNCNFLKKLGESWGIVETDEQKADRIAKEAISEAKRKAAETAERKRLKAEKERIELDFKKLADSFQTPS